jgi:HTH-type transcriptional regulator/antitoxin HipB
MRARTPVDVGLLIRDQRRKKKLRQVDLARRLRVSRQWLIAAEQGNAGAELGLVLRTLAALGLELDIAPPGAPSKRATPTLPDPPIDLDALLSSKRGRT